MTGGARVKDAKISIECIRGTAQIQLFAGCLPGRICLFFFVYFTRTDS